MAKDIRLPGIELGRGCLPWPWAGGALERDGPVDTLRADRLGFYGYGRPTAPHLAELARSAVVFRNARSQAEELLDPGQWGHCRDIAYDTVLATPLVLWIPGGPRGVERSALALNVDLVPTLLGLPYDPAAFAAAAWGP